ncbi:MAG: hypothetical protein AAGG55_01240 [Pseudomonadota bacterium]
MSRISTYIGFGLIAALVGCDAIGGGAKALPGGVVFKFTAQENEAGNCQPEREGLADVGSTGLFAVRGQATYAMPEGDTNIPFQGVFRYPDDNGFADDKAIVALNYSGTCAELAVKIRIDYCEYDIERGREERACPEIRVDGSDDFSAIELIRSDLESGES